jgi:hypothetical protein
MLEAAGMWLGEQVLNAAAGRGRTGLSDPCGRGGPALPSSVDFPLDGVAMGTFLVSLQPRRPRAPVRGDRRRSTRTLLSLLLGGVLASSALLVLPAPSAHAAPLNDCVAADNGDPVLTSFERTPAEVDVTAARQRVRFRLEVDDLGGPGPVSGAETVWVGFGDTPNFDEVDFIPTARLVQDATGAWVGSIVVPRWSRPDSVRLGVMLVDKAWNFRFVDASDLAAEGFPSRVTVVSTPDRTPPRLTSLRINPAAIDTRASPVTVTVTATARDSQSGVRLITVRGLGSIRLTKVPGTRRTFSGTRHVGRWAGSGTRRVYDVRVEDRIGNGRSYGYRSLGEAGFDRDLRIVSRDDTEPPAVARFSLEPTSVDVRTAGQTVTVRVRAVDRQAGLRSVGVLFWAGDTGWTRGLHLVSGTARDGVWEGEFRMRRCVGWPRSVRVSVFLTDDSGRRRSYSAARLADEGWPSRVAVTAADHIAPMAGVSFRPVPLAGPITVRFSEDVNGITASSVLVRRLIGDFDHGPPLPGAWVCRDAADALTDCETGRVRVARFRPTDPLAASREYTVTLNPEFSLAVTDLAGNPFRGEELFVLTAPPG